MIISDEMWFNRLTVFYFELKGHEIIHGGCLVEEKWMAWRNCLNIFDIIDLFILYLPMVFVDNICQHFR